jgi:NAD(P)-dependent dehydrogenase (short-subunit alcohol dehydrogenase family)
MDPLFDLAGRRALITGSGQNLGAGIASTLGRLGAHVVVNDLVAARAQGIADDIESEGGRASIAVFDVTDFDAVMTGIESVGPVDILVNNAGNAGAAGWTGDGAFVDTTPADWSAFFAVNLYGVMHCVRAVTPSMIERGWGRVITIISDAARVGETNMAAYAAAKAGAAGFTRAYAREVGRYDITANNIAIATMHRPTSDASAPTDEQAQRMREVFRRYIVRRHGEPAEVAGLVAYLASPLGAWVSGQTYPVNGGYSIAL